MDRSGAEKIMRLRDPMNRLDWIVINWGAVVMPGLISTPTLSSCSFRLPLPTHPVRSLSGLCLLNGRISSESWTLMSGAWESVVRTMGVKMTDEVLKRVGEALRSHRRRLSLWMTEHHDEFAALLKSTGADWNLLAAEFTRLGFLSRGGKPLTATATEKTWLRARRSIAASRRLQTPPPRPSAMAPPPDTRHEPIRPVRADLPATIPESSAPKTTISADEVQKRLKKLDDDLNSRSGSLPEPIH